MYMYRICRTNKFKNLNLNLFLNVEYVKQRKRILCRHEIAYTAGIYFLLDDDEEFHSKKR